ncbi:MAG: Holliday junction ATP-dependent helicase ruvA [Gemmatimonadetes bacterium]|jgi:Holliday junction DNA helicase RuvA|nr:Holliday junction ATP-dependent helicase ruvA [Gemmatimonadota bacterium]
MIVQVAGVLITKELDRVEILTDGGVAYELAVPLNAYEALPKAGERAALHTYLVVKEDGWQLFGFTTSYERRVFQKVLGAKGVGPALALGLLSSLTADRLVRAIREKDVPTLQSVPRVGRKKAEQLILDLADKLDELQQGATAAGGAGRPSAPGTEDAIRALASLGYSTADAEKAVRGVLDAGARGMSAPELIRAALARIGGR